MPEPVDRDEERQRELRELRKRAERIVASLDDVTFDPSLVTASAPLSPWHEAAAVLSTFEFSALQPASRTRVPRIELLPDLLQASLGRWTLNPTVRVRALRQLGSRGAMKRVLNANRERSDDALQRMLEAVIRGTGLAIESLSAAELTALAQVTEWLSETITTLPDRTEIIDRLDYLRLLEPFERLVGDHFRGREKELATLSDYVGVFSASSAGEKIARAAAVVTGHHTRPPLVIVAAGGAGKSTLIAKFILDHAHAAEAERFPFAYLDFDRPSIMAEEPATILVEAVRQVGIQYRFARPECESLRRKWQADLAQSSVFEARPRLIAQRRHMVAEFGDLMRSIRAHERPFLLVLDTFEEVQYARRSYVEHLWNFIELLQAEVPRVRFVIAGRAGLSGFDIQPLPLPDLEEGAARGFLESRGIDAAVAAAVVKQVGCNPLSLWLASAVLTEPEEASAEGIRGLRTSRFLRSVSAAEIQGQLFRRILGHIHDEEVRHLAYPGLALRRITSEIIAHVLAEPCGVRVDSDERANELFEELGREMFLVTPADDGALVHRPDVRRLMLPLLDASDPERTQIIERNAIGFYETQSDVRSRAEEIYHRLRLGQSRETIEERWMEGVEPYLQSAYEEMTASRRLILAEHEIGPPPDSEMVRNASQDEWERSTKIAAETALESMNPSRALQLIRKSKRQVGSELGILEARALIALGKIDDALKVTREVINEYTQTHNGRLLFKSYLLLGEAAAFQGASTDAAKALDDALCVASENGDVIGLLSVRVRQVVLGGVDGAATLAALHAEFDQAEDFILVTRPDLVRDVVRVLGDARPEIVARALRLIGFAAPPDSAWRNLLSTMLRRVDARLHERASRNLPLANRLEDLDDEAGMSWPRFAMSAPEQHLANWLAALLVTDAGEAQLVTLIRERVTHVETSTGSSTDWMLESVTEAPDFNRDPSPRVDRSRLQDFRVALASATTYEELSRMLAFNFSQRLEVLTTPGKFDVTLSELLFAAERRGWLRDLIVAVARWWPNNESLLRAVDLTGLGIVIPPWSIGGLPSRVLSTNRVGVAHIDHATCSVTVSRRTVASGLAINRDLVLTADGSWTHALGSVSFLFPSALGTSAVRPKRVLASKKGLSLIRLAEPVDEQLIDGDGRERRGFFAVEHRKQSEDAFMLWREGSLRVSVAALPVPPDLSWATGSILPGAACFTEQCELAGAIGSGSNGLSFVTPGDLPAIPR